LANPQTIDIKPAAGSLMNNAKQITSYASLSTLLIGLMILISGCSDPSSEHTSSTIANMTASQSTGYQQVLPDHNLVFPADHLAHDGFKIEWWYLTANLTTTKGEDVGVQWTQFRIALAPKTPSSTAQSPALPSPELSMNRPPAWATDQLYMAHAAVTSAGEHLIAEKWSRAHPQLAGVERQPFQVHLQDWQWQSQSNDLFPATLKVNNDQFSYQLQLNSQQPLQLQGKQGYSSKSADQSVASYYYSQPFIDVTGQITRHGVTEKVSGKAWLDREWSSQFLTKAQQGWDWFSLRLDDDSTLMVFRLRGQTNKDNFYSARRMFADGSGRNINSKDNPNDISMEPTQWQQTALGYHPIAWRIGIKSEAIDITTQALNPNSDMLVSTSYWEGPITIAGSHQGQGYMELTGYR
jgi:predicted secreted hydrolase